MIKQLRAAILAAVVILLLLGSTVQGQSQSLALSHNGVYISALAAALGHGGLAISLAARDTIAGFTILVDQPFRIGDRIEIQEGGTWGDVVDMGLPTDVHSRPGQRSLPSMIVSFVDGWPKRRWPSVDNHALLSYTFIDLKD